MFRNPGLSKDFPTTPYPTMLSTSCTIVFFFSLSHPTVFGVHQKTGNCLWMLFTSSATANINPLPRRMKGMNIHPMAVIVGSTAARTAVAPRHKRNKMIKENEN